jgi:hypothetical protein
MVCLFCTCTRLVNIQRVLSNNPIQLPLYDNQPQQSGEELENLIQEEVFDEEDKELTAAEVLDAALESISEEVI